MYDSFTETDEWLETERQKRFQEVGDDADGDAICGAQPNIMEGDRLDSDDACRTLSVACTDVRRFYDASKQRCVDRRPVETV